MDSFGLTFIDDDFAYAKNPSFISDVRNFLNTLRFNLEKISFIPCRTRFVAFEIESMLKQFDYVLLYTDLSLPKNTRLICDLTAKLFKQDLSHCLAQSANCNGYQKFDLNNENSANFECKPEKCYYVQRLFILDNSEALPRQMVDFLGEVSRVKQFEYVLSESNDLNAVKHDRERFIQNINELKLNENVRNEIEFSEGKWRFKLKSNDVVFILDTMNHLKSLNNLSVSLTQVFIKDLTYNSHILQSIRYIEESLDKYGPDALFLCFNGGKDCTVLLHLVLMVLKTKYPNYTKQMYCMYVQNLNPFDEINSFIKIISQRYSMEIVTFQGTIKASLEKVLAENRLEACFMGTRRTDPYSEHLETFMMTDKDWPQVCRVSPILDWSYHDVWDYLVRFKVPYCTLYDEGYTSLGSKHNTVKNPELLYTINGEEVYLPAYKLLDGSQERNGRIQS